MSHQLDSLRQKCARHSTEQIAFRQPATTRMENPASPKIEGKMITKKTTKNPISSRSSVTTSSPLLSDQISGQQLSFQHQETTNSHFFFPSFANWFVSSDRQVEQLSVKARDWPMLVHRMTHAKRCKRQQQRACNCVPKKLWLVLHKKNRVAR